MTYSAPAERVVDVGGGAGPQRDAPPLRHVLDHLERRSQRGGIEVVEDDLGVGQGRSVGEVHHQLGRPVRASSTDERDLGGHRRRRYPPPPSGALRAGALRAGALDRCPPLQCGHARGRSNESSTICGWRCIPTPAPWPRRRGRAPPRSCATRWRPTAWPMPCSPPGTRSWRSSTRSCTPPTAFPGATSSSSTWTSTWVSAPTTPPGSSAGSGSASAIRSVPAGPLHRRPGGSRGRSAGATPGSCADHPLDLCCLGIGENGHLAFNDPPVADFDDPLDMKVVELDGDCRRQQVHEGHFPDFDACRPSPSPPPSPPSCRAATVLAVVPEARKAEPVRAGADRPGVDGLPGLGPAHPRQRHPVSRRRARPRCLEW